VDEQRRYLGGDSDHSILVKGLDIALLEQNKARLASASSKQDDEALEEVFAQTASTSSAPALKKRSRADIIKELKEKRANGGELEQPKEEAVAERRPDSSKFRPIGFKPIGASPEKAKKKKVREGGEPKKKKRKVNPSATDVNEQIGQKDNATPPPADVEQSTSTSRPRQSIEPEPMEDDLDIFADAGEYKGVDLGSDDDNPGGSDTGHERPPRPGPSVAPAEDTSTPLRRGWFDDAVESELEVPQSKAPVEQVEQRSAVPETRMEAEEEEAAHLVPLTSSAMPSIRDFLAMDEAVEREGKRKAKKEKRKGKNKGS
jgi:IK cytokine